LLALTLTWPLAGCGPDCAPTTGDGELTLLDPALVDDGESMRLSYQVHNGTGAAVYVHDGIAQIVFDEEAGELALGLVAPTFPEDLHVFGAGLCYRKVPAGCDCDVRREVLREYTRLAPSEDGEVAFEAIPVHEADRVSVELAWGARPMEPDDPDMSREAYETWKAEEQAERLDIAFDRDPQARAVLVEETEPTSCPWVFFP
jgi:hypothetical protein